MKLLSTSNELKVDERNKHSELNKMHVPMALYGYIIQAFRLPFMTQHSQRSNELNNYGRQLWQEYNTEDSDEKHYYYGYSITRQLLYISS